MTARSAVRRAAIAAAAILASALVMATMSGAAHPAALTGTDVDRLAVSSYTDVTDMDAAGVPVEPVTRDKAITLANDYLGLAGVQVTVLLARAPLIRGQADRDVWIVICPGTTTAPMDGPAGAPPPVYTLTAVMFDAVTGGFIKGYMR